MKKISFNYFIKEDYDSCYKINNKKIKCYSKDKYKDLDKEKIIVGELKSNRKKNEIGTIKFDGDEYKVFKYHSYNRIFYRESNYVQISDNEFLILLKFNFLIIFFIIGILFLLGGVIFNFNKPEQDILTPDFNKVEEDINQKKDEESDPAIKVIIPAGDIETDIIINKNDKNKDIIVSQDKDENIVPYSGTANIKFYLMNENGVHLILDKDDNLKDGKISKLKLDFTKLDFELKTGIYEGKFLITFSDGSKKELKIKIIVVKSSGGTTGIGYSNKVNVNLSTGKIDMMFKEGKSTHKIILQLIVKKDGKEYLLSESGVINSDSVITVMKLNDNMNKVLMKGSYEGILRVYFEKDENVIADVHTDIEVTINVN